MNKFNDTIEQIDLLSSSITMLEQFKLDVEQGLNDSPKTLPSKYFYDKKGDDLFVKIMNMSEYYLSRAELEIFTTQAKQIIKAFELSKENSFDLIELGAGDGTKTIELLKVLLEQEYSFNYLPVDISQNALDGLENMLSEELPTLSVKKQQGDYFQILSDLKENENPKIILFLGSNIGNMTDDLATQFIYDLGTNLRPNDKLLLGVDLIKSKDIVLPAYNDKEGITSDFNMNLLDRINNELGANFNLESFKHAPEYSETEGIAKSFISSTVNQEVHISSLNQSFNFKAGEKIHTEISRKYSDTVLGKILKETDFSISKKFTDSKNYFADYILLRN